MFTKQELSSSQTFFTKFVVSTIFITVGIVGFNAFLALAITSRQSGLWLFVFLFMVWAVMAIHFCRNAIIPLKVVSIDDRFLYVSNFFKEIAVPISEIEEVKKDDSSFRNGAVVVRLKSPTEFGQEIKFIPQSDLWFWKDGSTSVVQLLEELTKAHTKTKATVQ